MDAEKNTLAERLKAALAKRNMTPAELCKRTKIGKSSMSEYMAGKFTPKADKIYDIARALGISPLYLQGKIDTENEDVTDEDKAVLAIYHKLNDMGKKTIIATMKSYTLMPEFSAVSFDQAAKDILASPLFPDAQEHNAALARELRILKNQEKAAARDAKNKK